MHAFFNISTEKILSLEKKVLGLEKILYIFVRASNFFSNYWNFFFRWSIVFFQMIYWFFLSLEKNCSNNYIDIIISNCIILLKISVVSHRIKNANLSINTSSKSWQFPLMNLSSISGGKLELWSKSETLRQIMDPNNE